MPAKNVYKTFVEDGIYHVYNRGVEKRKIFLDDQDYKVFLHLLKYYLSPVDKKAVNPVISIGNTQLVRPRPLKNLEKEVDLIAYCLMPNHFHLLLLQKTIDGMTKLLRRVSTTYALYFNRRYKRVGYLFQGRYKAAQVENDASLLHISRYIHLNPKSMTRSDLVSYPYSSYTYFIRFKQASWLKPDKILQLMNSKSLAVGCSSYFEFVEQFMDSSEKFIKNIVLDIDEDN